MTTEWAAGFVAAEGSLYWQTNGRRTHCTARLDVGQKERAPLESLLIFGGKIYFDKSASVWKWYVIGKRAERVAASLAVQPISIDWVVGFWEGDGSIVPNNGNFATPRVLFSNKNVRRLEAVRALGGDGPDEPSRVT